MNKTQKLSFIEGTFNDTEAKEILINVFTAKINFHQVKNFSSQERFGKVDNFAAKRIIELRKGLEEALELVKEAQEKQLHLQLSSEITITLTPGNQDS